VWRYEYSEMVTATTISAPTPSLNQARALDAAVELVGTEGIRALTHARVDAGAGLPKGSTSNYFRTRTALLTGVLDWIVGRELASVAASTLEPQTIDDFIDSFCALIEYTSGPARTLTRARLSIFLEASHMPELHLSISRGRTALESSLTEAFRRLGAPDPVDAALAAMACAEGIILHRVARGDTTDPRPVVSFVIQGAFPTS
jgi:DNA-binding transcriptional regulator YbjK